MQRISGDVCGTSSSNERSRAPTSTFRGFWTRALSFIQCGRIYSFGRVRAPPRETPPRQRAHKTAPVLWGVLVFLAANSVLACPKPSAVVLCSGCVMLCYALRCRMTFEAQCFDTATTQSFRAHAKYTYKERQGENTFTVPP